MINWKKQHNCLLKQSIKDKAENTKLKELLENERWIPVNESMPKEEKVYEVLDIVRKVCGFSLFQFPANRNPWRSTKILGEIRTITHWRQITFPEVTSILAEDKKEYKETE